MIFYNQPHSAERAVRLTLDAGGEGWALYEVDLRRLSDDVSRIVFCLSIAGEARTFSELASATIELAPLEGSAMIRYPLSLGGADEAAMILGELYRRQEHWRFRAVGQGFRGGLAPLARSFGVDVEG